MYITHGKTIHFCKDDQAQRSSTTKPSWTSPAHTEIPATKAHVSCQVKLQYNLTAGAHCHQFQLVQLDQKRTRVQQGLNPSLPSWIPSFLMWHKAGMTWHKASYVSFLLQPIRSRIEGSHNQAMKASWTTWNQFIIMPKTCTLWFMDQAHEPQIGKLREMWFGWHQRDLQ